MSVGNCTQAGKCPQAIRTIYNPQTGTYVVDPETQPLVYPQAQNPERNLGTGEQLQKTQ